MRQIANTQPKKILALALLVALALSALGFVHLARDVGEPFGSFLTYYNVIASNHYISQETPRWWLRQIPVTPELMRSPLMRIDGQPFTSTTARQVFREAAQDGKEELLLAYNAHGLQFTRVPVMRFTWRHYLDFTMPLILLTICMLLIAFTVLQSGRLSHFNRALLLACMGAALGLGGTRASLWWHIDTISKTLDLVYLASHVVATIGLFRIIRLFPDHIYRTPLRKFTLSEIAFFSLVSLGGLAWIVSRLLLWSDAAPQLTFFLDKWAYYTVTNISLVVIPLYGLGKLVWVLLRKSTSRKSHRMTRNLLIGLLLSSPAILVSYLNSHGMRTPYQFSTFDVRYLLLTLFTFFATQTLRYRSFGKTPFEPLMLAMILSSSGLLSSLMTEIFLRTTNLELQVFNLPPNLFFFVLAAGSGLVWGWMFARKGMFKSVLHTDRLSLENLQQFIRIIFENIQSSNANAILVSALSDSLHTDHAAFWRQTARKSRTYRLMAATRGDPECAEQLLLEDVPTQPEILSQEREDELFIQLIPNLGKDAILIPMIRKGETQGFFVLETAWDRDFFSEDDTQTILLITDIGQLFLLVNYHMRIRASTVELAMNAQQYERQRIFRTIHDQTLQKLAFLQTKFSQVRSLAPADQARAAQMINDMRYDLEDLSIELRDIIARLREETREDLNLRTQISEMLSEMELHHPQIETDTNLDDSAIDKLHDEQKIVLLSVFKRAVDNVVQHAQATQLTLQVNDHGETVQFAIRDNGVGCTPGDWQDAHISQHFGLFLMKQDTEELLNGRFSFISIPGEGTLVQGEFNPGAHLA